jgi:hypothetical protein
MKMILTLLALFLFTAIAFVFWMSPRLGGLLNFGKDSISQEIHKLQFDTISNKDFGLVYSKRDKEEALINLKKTYALDSLVAHCNTDFEKVSTIQSWVQSRWEHNGDNVPEKSDALYILKEAEKGKQFRCVEYSIVANQCLASLGFIVRSLGLMTKDVEEVKFGAGHVVNEVYLYDLKKWVMIDPQFDVITTYNGEPLNAVELQACIANKLAFEIINPNETISKEDYEKWIGPYLYYFTISINGQNITWKDRLLGTKKQICLQSIGTKQPKYFQNLIKLNNNYYTNSLNDFYPKLN